MTPGRVAICLTLALTSLSPLRGAVSADPCLEARDADAEHFASACTETAVREPYKLAWLILARICGLDATPPRACDWQSWATFADTFPADPDHVKPNWSGDEGRYPPTPVANCSVGGKKRDRSYGSPDPCEKIYDFRFNQEAFDYIVDEDLWYQEGLAGFWSKDEPIDFPIGAIALQAGWKKIEESQKDDYHWVASRDAEGEPVICGLIGIDIKSKVLPKWLWIAFEHVDNPGRCDVIGCRDDFGQSPTYTAPHQIRGEIYEPAEAPTEQLRSLLPSSQGSPWKSYRLKGVMSDFVESDGRPTVLASSAPQIEGDFFPAAPSCITCHSRARFDDQGDPDLDWSAPDSGFPVVRGAPDPAWFYAENAGTSLPWQLEYKQSNFVWSVPLYACPKMPE